MTLPGIVVMGMRAMIVPDDSIDEFRFAVDKSAPRFECKLRYVGPVSEAVYGKTRLLFDDTAGMVVDRPKSEAQRSLFARREKLAEACVTENFKVRESYENVYPASLSPCGSDRRVVTE